MNISQDIQSDNFDFLPIKELSVDSDGKNNIHKKLSSIEHQQKIEILINAIRNKDRASVSHCLEYKLKLTGKPDGKNTIAQLVAENFDINIANKLFNKGISLNHIHKLFNICIENDDMEGLHWFIINDDYKYKHIKGSLVKKACDKKSLYCLKYLLEKENYDEGLVKLITPYGFNELLNQCVEEKNTECFKTFIKLGFNRKINSNIMTPAQVGYMGVDGFHKNNNTKAKKEENVFRRWFINRASDFNYPNCVFIMETIKNDKDIYKDFKSCFPVDFHVNRKITDGLKDIDNKKSFYVTILKNKSIRDSHTIKANNFFELLLLHGSNALIDIIKNKKGLSIISQLLEKPEKLNVFLCYSNLNVVQPVIKACKKDGSFKDWKDSEGNNLAHYLLALRSTRSMFNFVYGLDKKLCKKENNDGIKPIHKMKKTDKDYAFNKILKKHLKENNIGVQAIKNKKRKM